jgi:hypothetical protein
MHKPSLPTPPWPGTTSIMALDYHNIYDSVRCSTAINLIALFRRSENWRASSGTT